MASSWIVVPTATSTSWGTWSAAMMMTTTSNTSLGLLRRSSETALMTTIMMMMMVLRGSLRAACSEAASLLQVSSVVQESSRMRMLKVAELRWSSSGLNMQSRRIGMKGSKWDLNKTRGCLLQVLGGLLNGLLLHRPVRLLVLGGDLGSIRLTVLVGLGRVGVVRVEPGRSARRGRWVARVRLAALGCTLHGPSRSRVRRREPAPGLSSCGHRG